MIAALIGAGIVLALTAAILLASLEALSEPVGGASDRPGEDDQWSGADFRATVPNIRRAADEELAWHPTSLDTPDPREPFVWLP